AGFDLAFLAALGFVPGRVRCTMLLSRLLHGTRHARGFHGLGACAQRELGQGLDKAEQKSDWAGSLTYQQLAYAARDAAVLVPLAEALDGKIKAAGLERVADIECRCLPAMVWLARSGVALDRGAWETVAVEATTEADRLARELDALAPSAPQPTLDGGGWCW